MKTQLCVISTALLATFAFASNTFAQDYTQWSLPEGAKARLGKGGVKAIQYSPDGTRLAVVSNIGIWLYDAETYQELSLLTGHTWSVTSVAFSPNSMTLAASGGEDAIIHLWDVATGTHKQTLTTQRLSPTKGAFSNVAFSPDGQTLASSDHRGIHLWDLFTGAHKYTLVGHADQVLSVSFSPDGKTLASGSEDATIRLWDVATGSHKQTLTGHTDWVNSIAFSPDGKTLASADGNSISRSENSTIRLWDATTGQHKQTLIGHKDQVTR